MSPSAHTTVLIAESDFIYRNALEKIIREIDGVSAVIKARNAEQAIDLLQENHECAIAVIACRTPEINAAALTREIKSRFPRINIIALSHAVDFFSVIEMIESGALSYIVKGATRSDYREAVNCTIRNKAWFSPSVAQYIIQNIHNDNQVNTLKKSAAASDFDIIKYVCMEFTSEEIEQKTGIPKRTVEDHRSKLIKQFNVRFPVGLAVESIRRGIINIDAIDREKKEVLDKEKKKKKQKKT